MLLPLWHPQIAIGSYYLYATVEKFPVQVIPGHRYAPPPPMGAGLAQGGNHHLKRGFLLSRLILFSSVSDRVCDQANRPVQISDEQNSSGFENRMKEHTLTETESYSILYIHSQIFFTAVEQLRKNACYFCEKNYRRRITMNPAPRVTARRITAGSAGDAGEVGQGVGITIVDL